MAPTRKKTSTWIKLIMSSSHFVFDPHFFVTKNFLASFLSPVHEIGAGDIVITMSGREPVPCHVTFLSDISGTVSRIAFILHTDIP